ncbi:MAG: PCYCGC motif-containing (lipo)protein [Gemmatimonadota bacterium]
MTNDSTRREFVLLWSGAFLSLATGVRTAGRPGMPSCHQRVRHVVHPEPRPGITAARVLPREKLTDHPDAVTAFEQVRQIPQIVDGIGCHCGCASRAGFYSLLSCYEGEGMAMMCEVCQGQGRLAFRLFNSGKTLDQIRAAIDARYG